MQVVVSRRASNVIQPLVYGGVFRNYLFGVVGQYGRVFVELRRNVERNGFVQIGGARFLSVRYVCAYHGKRYKKGERAHHYRVGAQTSRKFAQDERVGAAVFEFFVFKQ